jgi:hypothetical protein
MFNAGVSIGLVLMAAGTWLIYGVGPALLISGGLVWVTTLIATGVTIALQKGA